MPAAEAAELDADYRELRRVEHRLQMIADRQTHALPASEGGPGRFRDLSRHTGFPQRIRAASGAGTRSFPRLLHHGPGHRAGRANRPRRRRPTARRLHRAPYGTRLHRHAAYRRAAACLVERTRAGAARATGAGFAGKPAAAALRRARRTTGPGQDIRFVRHAAEPAARQRAIAVAVPAQPGFAAPPRRRTGCRPGAADHLANDAQALEALLSPNDRYAAPKPVLRRLLQDAPDLEQAVAVTRHFVRREDFHLSGRDAGRKAERR